MYKFGKLDEKAGEVKVTYDPSIIIKEELSEEEVRKRKREFELEKRTLIGGTENAKLGLESSLGKEERIWRLKQAITAGRCVTVASAMKELGLSRGTILKYAKEADLELYDEVKHEWLGSIKKEEEK